MSVLLKIRVPACFIKDFRFGRFLVAGQQRPQKSGSVVGDREMVNDTQQYDQGKHHKYEADEIGYQRMIQSFRRLRQVQYPPKIMAYLRAQSHPAALERPVGQRASLRAMIRFAVLPIDSAYILFPREFP
jgi:hypothetical protein